MTLFNQISAMGFDGDTENELPLEMLSIQRADEFRKNIFKDLEFTKFIYSKS